MQVAMLLPAAGRSAGVGVQPGVVLGVAALRALMPASSSTRSLRLQLAHPLQLVLAVVQLQPAPKLLGAAVARAAVATGEGVGVVAMAGGQVAREQGSLVPLLVHRRLQQGRQELATLALSVAARHLLCQA